jgi:hypothetical protein
MRDKMLCTPTAVLSQSGAQIKKSYRENEPHQVEDSISGVIAISPLSSPSG